MLALAGNNRRRLVVITSSEPRPHGDLEISASDLTMVAGTRKVLLAPRGRERRMAVLDPGSHQK